MRPGHRDKRRGQQDIERGEDGPTLRRGVARDGVVSAHDPEMRHGRKSKASRFDGHKAEVVVDTDEAFVTAVTDLAGNAPDHDQALAMVAASPAIRSYPGFVLEIAAPWPSQAACG